ncbi:PREDICTED: 5'-3' exoribonuclease 3-like isoform X2 [Nelumbo nucifera]|uniref:5'-3' exoribonuclease 3-like isoform X2 n=1 Tax=Nelumbo nucifera TaxID=4432 RepID=A0A1U8PZH5_NELNU|nr:PREDICTED: 5'-3' exoribonuclease 3-like isoform X2 [Nelumbo nucifera]
MGVPSFYRWLVHKYPSTVVNAVEERGHEIDSSKPNPNGIEFDNLYLDMNGIIHPCFHPEDELFPPTTFQEVFERIFEYIDRLFRIVRPRKLLYMAVDGVAPRAKMNQQRSRRFRAAKDAEMAEVEEERLRQEFELQGKLVLPKQESEVSDSNIITPGTEFMFKLSEALQSYIRSRLNNDPGWKQIKVILSDANVPGEGEHKIMSFIRLQRNLPGYNPNTRHCLHGLDADLIVLALATHEVHFSILREDLLTQEQQPICMKYLESSIGMAESGLVKQSGWFRNINAMEGCRLTHKKPYQFLNIWSLREYLKLDMQISDPPFEVDLERLIDDFIFICFFTGNDFLPHLPTLEIHEGSINLMMSVYKEEFKNLGGYLVDMSRVEDKKCGYVKSKRVEKFILKVGTYEEKIFKKRSELRERRIRKLMREIAEAQDENAQIELEDSVQFASSKNLRLDATNDSLGVTNEATSSLEALGNRDEVVQNTKELNQKLKDYTREKSDLFKQGGFEKDRVKLGTEGWKQRYYKEKFSVEGEADLESKRKEIVEKYTEGLFWVLRYYFSGVSSWTWFYPFHYGPFASDLKGLAQVHPKFKMDCPFKPFDQLMGVLPPRSSSALPRAYRELMISEESNIRDFYPQDFEVDTDGKRYMWQGITKLDFINEHRLVKETKKLEEELEAEEAKRNKESIAKLFLRCIADMGLQALSLYFEQQTSLKKLIKLRKPIDIISSGGLNGFICPCEEASLTISSCSMEELQENLGEDVLCVLYECPENHPHIPRLLEGVTLLDKTITEDDIVKEPLWHEYEGARLPYRLQVSRRYGKEVNNTSCTPDSSSPKEIFKAAGSGRGAGRERGRGRIDSLDSGQRFEPHRGTPSSGNRIHSFGSASVTRESGETFLVSGRGGGHNRASNYDKNFGYGGAINVGNPSAGPYLANRSWKAMGTGPPARGIGRGYGPSGTWQPSHRDSGIGCHSAVGGNSSSSSPSWPSGTRQPRHRDPGCGYHGAVGGKPSSSPSFANKSWKAVGSESSGGGIGRDRGSGPLDICKPNPRDSGFVSREAIGGKLYSPVSHLPNVSRKAVGSGPSAGGVGRGNGPSEVGKPNQRDSGFSSPRNSSQTSGRKSVPQLSRGASTGRGQQ